MKDKDYIEIYDENNNVKKMEIVLTFQTKEQLEYNYIVYQDIESKTLFGGKIKIGENSILETNLTDKEKKIINENLKYAFDE